ncbi:MAG: hypothetical protein R3Y05_06420 [bacterium]
MRIDLHIHTKKIKTGDPETRNVSKEKFVEVLTNANVKIAAITNHNHFDYEQYNDFINDEFMIWPGIELDVQGENSIGHCIVICNPTSVKKFNDIILELKISNEDEYKITIDQLVTSFTKIDTFFVCHYLGKTPHLSEEDFDKLKSKLNGKIPLFYEASNLISAGIFMKHNINALCGSDVRDWNKYPKSSIPELKLEISSYDQFKLLTRKENAVIQSILEQKEEVNCNIKPFENSLDTLDLTIYRDLNIFFGGKGTGKTKILESLENLFLEKGKTVKSYYSNTKTDKYKQLIDFTIESKDFNRFNDSDMGNELNKILNWKEHPCTSILKYKNWKSSEKVKSKYAFTNSIMSSSNNNSYLEKIKKEYNELLLIKEKFKNITISNFLNNTQENQLNEILVELYKNAKKKVIEEYSKFKSISLLDNSVDVFKELYTKKKGTHLKPQSTGLINFYTSLLDLNNNCIKIKQALRKKSKFENKHIGVIKNNNKLNNVYLRLKYDIDPFEMTPDHKVLMGQNKLTMLRNFLNKIEIVINNSFNKNVTASLIDFSNHCNMNNISNISNFIGAERSIIKTLDIIDSDSSKDYDSHSPSNGEQSLLIISSVLHNEADVYILDEPEMSIGHDYINEVIIKKLRELSIKNKIIIISTHDANIAVRTLPYLTVYREDNYPKNKTFIGNPFTSNLVNIVDQNNVLDWKDTCLKCLEGGKEAFIERGDIYGWYD